MKSSGSANQKNKNNPNMHSLVVQFAAVTEQSATLLLSIVNEQQTLDQ
jgi:hypothetical protein